MKRFLSVTCTAALLLSCFTVSAYASESADSLYNSDLISSDTAVADGYSAKELYNMTAPGVVEITCYDENSEAFSRGSGFFINANGTIITNYHVIESAASATVETYDGTSYDVIQVMGYDANIDLAILRIDLTGNAYLSTASTAAETGDTIYTLGSALGFTGTFSDGMVSTASRVIDGVDYIQITAPISHGNSGGPLINIYGEVVGVNTMFYTEGQNLNFAINMNELLNLDLTSPLTMEEFYEQTGQTASDDIDEAIAEWMEDSDQQEVESNDAPGQADLLRNDYWMAAQIDTVDDFDVFEIVVVAETDLDVLLVPFYTEDMDYLVMALIDEEGNVFGYGESEETESGTMYLDLFLHIEEPGSYYVAVFVDDSYPYDEAAYYQLNAEW